MKVIGQVDFSHYTDDTVRLATDLVNTYAWVDRVESLVAPDDLLSFLEGHADLLPEPPGWQPTAADVAEVQALRARLREVFQAEDAATAARLINDILSHAGARPKVSVHGGRGPHFHFEPGGERIADRLGATAAMALATVLVEDGLERFGLCGAHDCDDAFVDVSKNRSKNYCSTTCTTRENVAAHRARAKEKAG